MRVLFFLLLLANLVLLALGMKPLAPAGMEPERLAQQLHPDWITVIDPATAALQAEQQRLAQQRAEAERVAQQAAQSMPSALSASPPPSAPSSAAPLAPPSASPSVSTHIPAAPPAPSAPAAAAPSSSLAKAVCVELGDFSAQAAESFEPQLSRLSITGIPQRRVVRPPPSYLVFVPPQSTEAAASRRLAQLREKGFADSAVIHDDTPRRRGVSVGLFSKEELAMAQVEKLHKAGVVDARMGEYPLNSTLYSYRLPGVTETGATRLAAVASAYAGVTMRPCK